MTIDVDGTESGADPAVLEACEACGWTPILVEVIEVMDWESVSKRQVAWTGRSQ